MKEKIKIKKLSSEENFVMGVMAGIDASFHAEKLNEGWWFFTSPELVSGVKSLVAKGIVHEMKKTVSTTTTVTTTVNLGNSKLKKLEQRENQSSNTVTVGYRLNRNALSYVKNLIETKRNKEYSRMLGWMSEPQARKSSTKMYRTPVFRWMHI